MTALPADKSSLVWSARLLTWEALRAQLNGQRTLVVSPHTLVTPLVVDELRARGIALSRAGEIAPMERTTQARAEIGYAQEKPDPIVSGAIAALAREGITLAEWKPTGKDLAAWSWSLGLLAKQGRGLVFASDAALVCCVAGKVAGVRPAMVLSVSQAARSLKVFAANLLAVEMPGRTFFEVKQIARLLAAGVASTPPHIAKVLGELDANR